MSTVSFDKKYKRLEEIVEWFDGPDFSLDKAEKMLDEGLKIIAELKKLLSSSKLKITRLEKKLDQS